MKKPEDCQTMEELRAEIDRVDGEMIDLLAERWRYVSRVSDFKAGPDEASVPWRNDEVIANVVKRAEAEGAPGSLAEEIWRLIINRAIAYEKDKLT